MANRYVYSGAAGTGTGADWANAHTTLSAAITAGAAGDVYYVAHDHAESTAGSVTLGWKGTAATPDRVLCVNRAGSVPPVAADLTTGASVTTTGSTNLFNTGYYYFYGIAFNAGTGAGTTNLAFGRSGLASLENCALNLVATGASSRVLFGSSSATEGARLNNCTMSFASTGQGINQNGGFLEWRNKPGSAAVTGATLPTNLFASQGFAQYMRVSGLDLSAFGAGKTLFASPSNTGIFQIANCKLGASVTIASAPARDLTYIDLIGCSATTNVQRNERYMFQGTLTTETTIVRTDGASDGTTAYSWKIATTADNKRDFPFDTFEGALWNTATGSAKTLTVHTVTDNVTLKDDEIWLEVEYLGSSATPVTSLVTDANATVLTTAANQAASTETWTTTGLGTPVYQKLEATFTPQMAGPIRWRVKVAKASTTVYVCPKAEIA